jgi:transcription-repair coupling factor (superfamily II helicase)
VAVDQAWQVSRYVGLGKRNPDLSKLGDTKWQRAKKKAQESIFEYAATMLRLQAERETSAGHEFGPDTHWQHEFESAFVYAPTPDQVRAIESAKQDMESTRPMDRLICGDVGFGKTEVAIRAAFKAVMGGKQVVMIAPTTVLAQQHYHNLRERMSDYPVVIESMNRFRPRSEQTKTLRGLGEGTVDIVVGTHRLLSADVVFKNLGLVVVDEEQRFGVKQKEALKDRFRLVDVLTLSATPIPRTLYLALMGARDMSLIETPPPNRKPVETVICAYDERVIRDAIQRELLRGGQVYMLHNRVRTIDKLAERIRDLCPGARVGVGHGQMEEDSLEVVMGKFVAGELDVLVSTTIIESGLDIPNANTIVIDRADRFGLADLYQLRGRVGRSHHKAYAFLMLPRDLMASGDARKRVMAIKQYSELGAGFKIAMRDLEIRGAGNILGTAQSGHILAIGFDLYCKMLQRSVSILKGEAGSAGALTTVRLEFLATNEPEYIGSDAKTKAPAFIPSAYIKDPRTRIEAYRKLADAKDREALDGLRKEWADRFGRLPKAVDNLLTLQKLRLAGAAKRLRSIEVRDDKLMLKRKDDFILFGGKFPRLTSPLPENKLREALEFLLTRQHL